MNLLSGIISFILVNALFNVTAVASIPVKKQFTVGIVLRLNDKYNDSVSSMATGIETAKILFEKTHPGVKIELKKYPHMDGLDSVVAAAEQVIKDKTPAAIGGELSEESFVLRDKLGPKQIPFISPTSSNPDVTEGHPFAFRACFSDRRVAIQMADLTIDHLKPKSVGVIHNVSSPYTDFLTKQFVSSFQYKMLKVSSERRIPVYTHKVLNDTLSFKPQIEDFMAKKVSHVIMMTHQNDLLRFVLQSANLGFFPVYVGSDGWGSNTNVTKNLITNSPFANRFKAYRNSYWKEDAQSSMAQNFKTQFRKTILNEPTAWSAISFDAAWILFSAMNQSADPTNGNQIRNAMANLKGLQLVTSENFSFGPDNSPRKDLYIYRLDETGVHHEVTLK